jgi:phage terminase small subunit
MTNAPKTKRKVNRQLKYSGAPTVVVPPAEELGPHMRALNERQRKFVLELAHGPSGYGAEIRACRAAGYRGSQTYLEVQTGRLKHDDKVQAALRELGIKMVRVEAFKAVRQVAAIAMNPNHRDQLKACIELMNRGGFSFAQEHNIRVEHEHRYSELSADEIMARIAALASQTGIEPAKLPSPVTIDVEPQADHPDD